MIDCHCHLEQRVYDKDRNELIEECKKEMKAVITCCAHPKNSETTVKMLEKHKNFVYATASIHPEYVKEINEREKDRYLDFIKENRNKLVGIGETGLDYYWIKENKWKFKQKELFVEMINFAKELNKPIIVHARDAFEDAINVLEKEGAGQVQMHMFGAHHLLERVVDNGWLISLNAIILKSKIHKKITRDCPLERILLETDAPWLAPEGGRNNPTTVRVVAERIAEVKKIPFEEVVKVTSDNAKKLFNL